MREALESVASEPMVPRLIAMALSAAGRGAVPEDAAPFAAFVEGALRTVVVQTLGHPSYEVVSERLSHVLAMATSQVRARETHDHAVDEREEDSRVRLAALPEAGRPGAVVEIEDPELPPPSDEILIPPAPRVPRQAQTLGRIQASRGSSRGAIEEDARRYVPPPTPPPVLAEPEIPPPAPAQRTVDTVRPPRTAPSRVLVATLDPLLIGETEGRLSGRSDVLAVGTTAELLAHTSAPGRIAIVIDTALPSIDVPTFAALAPSFPLGTVVVLWGMSERQKQRLVAMFPIAASWIASGVAASPADVLVRE
ncbi:hypothetical protein DB32_006861 [Sandaracinus amylolyticus]|uniref:Uncharacterized protein n=2 Tax=Sandaracinus amylolyticus TaxID=927083 RepID=A0A0F6W7U6_9BACT|nr:hypothetical protein DB32_006861 [Sandaracinus amylolyticus]